MIFVISCSLFILLILWLAWDQPRGLLKLISILLPGNVPFFIETQAPLIALTIDDSPASDPQATRKILEILDHYGVHATFFLIGDSISGQEDLIQQMIQAGHEIGNHLMHDQFSLDLPPQDFAQQLDQTHQILIQLQQQAQASSSATSATIDLNSSPHPVRIQWFRPGGGFYNQRILDQIQPYGYQCVLGSIFPYDTHIRSVPFATWHILTHSRPGEIIILHDGDRDRRGQRTAEVLARILPVLIQAKGLQVVTLSELARSQSTSP